MHTIAMMLQCLIGKRARVSSWSNPDNYFEATLCLSDAGQFALERRDNWEMFDISEMDINRISVELDEKNGLFVKIFLKT